ncbi:hypothetical protein EW145_g1823 [Phellinidium pouzarii]|uniref:Uncharacterized protein n=1 Tax=Phellinidium pouzarii TaxID=167371 RepID=A0A4S4LDA5_9AGAM|nr:hypothetical protein EW145_g1823 [Phellinidium pouzarii]
MHTDHEGKNGSAVTGRGRSSHIDLASDSDADAEDDSDDDSGNDDEKEGSALGLSTSDDRNMKLDAATVIGDLYEQCNVLKEKLHSLENAMSRLGGAQDAVRCIRKLRRSLQFSKDLNDFKKYGQINDAKDDTFYNSFAPMKSHVEKVLENAEAMKEAFHQFGSVNGCQLISLCGSLQRICLETGYIANKMSRTYKSVIDQGAIQVTLGGFDGPLAVADSGASSLSIYKDYQVSPQTIYLDTEKFFGTPKQLLWSPDNENLLIRMSNSLSLWSEKNSVRELFTSPILIQDALWIKDSLRVLVIQTELLTFIDGHTGLPVATLPLHGIRVVAAQGIGNDYLACIADDFLNGNTVRKLLVLNCNTAEVVYGGTRIKNSAYSLRLAKDDFDDNLNKVLLSFEDGSEPQLWYLKQSGLTLWEAKPMFKYDKGPSLCVSPASFAGGTNKLVVCVASYYESLNADTIWVWSTDEAMLIHRVDIEKVHSSLPISVSWKIDDFWQLALAAAYDDGKTVKTGKICFFDSIDAYQEMTKSDIQAVLKT